MIGPGLSPIPSVGWGAVEEVIYRHSLGLKALGHEVDIYNTTNFKEVATNINNGNYDIVINHYDEYIPIYAQLLEVPFVATQHFAYCTKPQYWGGYYNQIFQSLPRTSGLICLSDEIAAFNGKAGYASPMLVVRNGASNSFQQTFIKNNSAIYLGKIDAQDRKGQVKFLKNMPENFTLQVDFVGPNENSEFSKEIAKRTNCQYLGSWTKADLYDKLSSYSCLILMSNGEAAPLVVPEALVAGLSVVCSQAASANLTKEDFITVLDDNDFSQSLYDSVASQTTWVNHFQVDRIKNYAKQFEWTEIMKEYEATLENMIREIKE